MRPEESRAAKEPVLARRFRVTRDPSAMKSPQDDKLFGVDQRTIAQGHLDSTGMTSLLFVYGTLLPGQAPPAMRDLIARMSDLGPATVRGRLYDLGAYPGIILD